MKKLSLFILVLVMLLPTCVFADTVELEGTFHFPWGIDETDTFVEAGEKAAADTGFELTKLLSPDGKYLHNYYLYADGKNILGVPAEYIRLSPKSDKTLDVLSAILADDQESTWSGISIEFSDGIDYASSFATLYKALCETYGEPDTKTFSVTTITLDKKQYTDKDFPLDSDNAMAGLSDVIKDNDSFCVKASWYNVTLILSRYSDSISLSIGFSSAKPFTLTPKSE